MILFSFLSIIIEKSLSPSSFASELKDKRPLVVRFSGEHRPRSVQLNQDWARFSQMYESSEEIRVAHVNCGKFGRLCLRETAWDPPIVRMYINNTIVQYDGGMSYESLGDWTRRYSGVQGKYIHLDLLSPNNKTFHQLLSQKKCVFVMFHVPWCRKCQRFMGSLRDIARAYRNEGNVSICEVDSDKYKSFFFDYTIRKYPSMNLFVEGQRKNYEGELDKSDIIDYINDFCGTQRTEEGGLSSEAGVIDEVSTIVEDFMRKRNQKYITEMKMVDGTEQYVEIMEDILKTGNFDSLFRERERLASILSQESASQASQDKLKIKLNIISTFISYIDVPDE
ncbi:putative protein disulfide-isomerase A6 [Tritrichomonas foetus]|uniref:protein disulfide-isomerase n=1 Tax=Tritrichomonas foetus TaxID=1144522 RepID=A0A1J4J131_9EUKA|nr:putative protein disulfide-isomerase A6 [Tritrichomonas foetus]|eukprot:OHS93310.1 putative protein disulfide-isomerase A6 [Tritrichomonas foetus]